MGKIIEGMNFNYYNQESSNLAQTLLELYKVSLGNGTYSKMSELFKREIPSSKCFKDEKHRELDNLINFCNVMDDAIVATQTIDDYTQENIHSRKM